MSKNEKIVALRNALENVKAEAKYEMIIRNYDSETQCVTIALEEI